MSTTVSRPRGFKTIKATCCSKRAGYPTSAIIELMTGKSCNFCHTRPHGVKKLCAKFPFYVPMTIPANTYKGQTEPVNTVAMMALWVTSSDVDEGLIYKITKALWSKDPLVYGGKSQESGADILAKVHEQGKNITLKTALEGVDDPAAPRCRKVLQRGRFDKITSVSAFTVVELPGCFYIDVRCH